ncbi:hypothetical protein AGMMS49546_23740 [Spirochaetia bacterium]|nr:hypothetical protein AGMMS49546_23740 [Spirochaetia bacterium]
MTKKKKLLIGGVAVLFVLISLSGCASTVRRQITGMGRELVGMGEDYIGMGLTVLPSLQGNANATVAVKDYEPLELVFVTTTAKKGESADVYGLLLKEAQKLGAHGITNVSIGIAGKASSGEVKFTGSALAIKYTAAVAVPVTNNGFGVFR